VELYLVTDRGFERISTEFQRVKLYSKSRSFFVDENLYVLSRSFGTHYGSFSTCFGGLSAKFGKLSVFVSSSGAISGGCGSTNIDSYESPVKSVLPKYCGKNCCINKNADAREPQIYREQGSVLRFGDRRYYINLVNPIARFVFMLALFGASLWCAWRV